MVRNKSIRFGAMMLGASLGFVFASYANAQSVRKNSRTAIGAPAVNNANLLQLRCVEVRRNQTERTGFDQIFFRIDMNRMLVQEQLRSSGGWDFPSTPEAIGDRSSITETTIRFKTVDLGDVKEISKTIDRTTGRYTQTYALFGESRVRNNGAPIMTVTAQCSREPWTGFDAPPDKQLF